MPCSGLAPEAMAKAIASGSATTPTVMPETTFGTQWLRANSPCRQASTIAIIQSPA